MPFIIAIVGGSGSGKTTLSKELKKRLPKSSTILLDMYYKDASSVSLNERAKLNFDSPERFDENLFRHQLNQLKSGEPIDSPIYDFATHSRKKETQKIEPSDIIIVDGILSLWVGEKNLFDYVIFVKADADTRLGRRLLRDMRERGRSPESVISQYNSTVKPMHLKYVEPSKYEADFILDNEKDGGLDLDQVDLLLKKIERKMNE